MWAPAMTFCGQREEAEVGIEMIIKSKKRTMGKDADNVQRFFFYLLPNLLK